VCSVGLYGLVSDSVPTYGLVAPGEV